MPLFRLLRELMQLRDIVAKAGQNLQPSAITPLHYLPFLDNKQRLHRRQAASIYDPSYDTVERLFFGALLTASSCKKHNWLRQWGPCTSIPIIRTRSRLPERNQQFRRLHCQARFPTRQLAVINEKNRDEYIAMLDYYIDDPADDPTHPSWKSLKSPQLEKIDSQSHARPVEVDRVTEKQLCFVAISRLTNAIRDKNASADDIFKLYKVLPQPGVMHLSEKYRFLLLRRLSVVELKTQETTLQFLSVLDDMRAADFQISGHVWNSAIYLAGRTFARVGANEVEDALRTWKTMEQAAGIVGSSVTFNILFDIAVKAGQFNLAEMILQEMKQRDLVFTRFTRFGFIFYHGLRQDGKAIRKAYRDFVDAGEIVDTAVLNCVVASLLRAGEPTAADQVYERMKKMHAMKGGRKLPQLDWQASRDLRRILEKMSKVHRDDREYLTKLQNQQSVSPDFRTFLIFIAHHANHSGELNSIMRLIEEMQAYGLPVHTRIFTELFRGFKLHGGVRYTAWTKDRLKSVWETYIKLHDDGVENMYIDKFTVTWILRAFSKCCGVQVAVHIWDMLKARWQPDPEEEEVVLDVLETERHIQTRLRYPIHD